MNDGLKAKGKWLVKVSVFGDSIIDRKTLGITEVDDDSRFP